MKVPGFTLRGFRRPREIAKFALGKLEREVMDEVWRRGEISVRDAHRAFDERMAYTTLMTTLDRFIRKACLSNGAKEGRAFLYTPRLSPEQFRAGVAEDVIDDR